MLLLPVSASPRVINPVVLLSEGPEIVLNRTGIRAPRQVAGTDERSAGIGVGAANVSWPVPRFQQPPVPPMGAG